MPLLKDVAQYVRSKNAGPFWVTVDIFCGEVETFDRIRAAASLSGEAVGRIYGIPADVVRIFEDEPLRVVKISFPRREPHGSPHDADSHAGQYFVPLLTAEIP